MIHLLIVLVASLIGTFLFLYGWYSHQSVLSHNNCKMTYSQPKKTEIKIAGNVDDYKLWKVSNADNKKLNKYPVIFVPGHLGSVDQARSFSSYMHNDDDSIQYFALDFNNEPIATHAADILTKAVFLNKALETIIKLYESSGNKKAIKVGLLGHSYGGFVAKTSMVLSNHPKSCVVKLLVMLSTPNTRAPFSPDASFPKLFLDTNKAWYQSYYKDKSKCPTKYHGKDRIEIVSCAQCLNSTTVLSFTGGEIDVQVRPETTNIFEITARPKNITLVRQSSGKSTGMVSLSIFSAIKKQFWNLGKSLLTSIIPSSLFTSSTVSSLAHLNNTNAPVNETLLEEAASPLVDSEFVENPINESSPFAHFTAERWFKDMAQYHDPHHISIRTSQMTNVGFQIDHYAILWCYQFVSVTNSAMKKILQRKTSFNDFDLHKLLGIRNMENIEEFIVEPRKLGIQQLLNYIRRNETNNDFHKIQSEEVDYLHSILGDNSLQSYAVLLYLRHIQKLPVGIFNVGLMAIASTILALLLAEPYASAPASSLVTIMNVLDTRPFLRICSLFMAYGKKLVGSTINFLGLLGAVLSIVVWRVGWKADILDAAASTLFALGVGIAVKLAFAMFILIIRAIVYSIGGLLNMGGWGTISQEISVALSNSFIFSWLNEILSLVLVIGALLYVGLHTSVMFEAGTPISFFILWAFACCLCQCLSNSTGLGRKEGQNNQLADDLFFVHFLGVLLAIPSVLFSYNNLFIPHLTILFRTGVFDSFGPERLNMALTLMSLWLFGAHISQFRSKLRIEPLHGFQLIIEPTVTKKQDKNAICFHEDGGYKALFEAISESKDQIQVCVDVIDGPTYKVVQCFCPKNRSFKSAEEWCEWCRCVRCGYGKLIRNASNATDDLDKPRLHLDMVIILGLLFGLFYANYWGDNQMHVLFYNIGGVFFMLWCRLFFKKSTIALPDK